MIFLSIAGFIAGLVDSIAGGGGLVMLPAFTLVLGAGPVAVGSNKIPAVVGTLVALIIYARRGHLNLKKAVTFACWVGFGSLGGSLVAPMVPIIVFRWLLLVGCPVILLIVFKKDLWVEREHKLLPHRPFFAHLFSKDGMAFAFSGLACGFYDGIWGPGGGTFMFLALYFIGRLPLLGALGAAKLVNLASAAVALTTYGLGGYVHVAEGLAAAFGIAIGAFIGATQATKKAQRIVRPILVIVVVLLLIRLLIQWE